MVFKKGEHGNTITEFKKGTHHGTEFQKGNIPYNKGKKRGSLSPETEFKCGEHPANFKGYYRPHVNMRKSRRHEIIVTIPEQITRISRGRQYKSRKRISLARHLWEKTYGNIPKGMCVYNSSNGLDVSIENLALVSRQELLRINRKEI